MRDWPANPRPHYPTAIFLDRDGTINVDTHYPHKIEELRFYPGALEALRRIGRLPVHVVVVSNQAGIAHGRFTEAQMSRFNREILRRVTRAGGRIDAFYFCPHREAHELVPGEAPCPCAKPKPGMLLEAAEDYRLDLHKSVIVGDKSSDVIAGETAGCSTILVRTGKAGRERGELEAVPDLVVDDLAAAARHLEREVRTLAAVAP